MATRNNTYVKLIMVKCVLELTVRQNPHFFLTSVDIIYYPLQNFA